MSEEAERTRKEAEKEEKVGKRKRGVRGESMKQGISGLETQSREEERHRARYQETGFL